MAYGGLESNARSVREFLAHVHGGRLIAQALIQADCHGIVAEDIEVDMLPTEGPHRGFQCQHRRPAITLAAILFVDADEPDEGSRFVALDLYPEIADGVTGV